MMTRPEIKNTYIKNFLKSLDKDTSDKIMEQYEAACVPKFTFQNSGEYKAINAEFNNDASFVAATGLCGKIRSLVNEFESSAMAIPSAKDWNYDLWQLRVEEIFMLKVFCIESAKGSDALLMAFIAYIKQGGNTTHAYFPNVVGLKFNDLISGIIKIYDEAMMGKLPYKIVNNGNAKIVELIKKNRELTEENSKLNDEKNIWMEKLQKLIELQGEMQVELDKVKEEQQKMKAAAGSRRPSVSGESFERVSNYLTTSSDRNSRSSDDGAVELESMGTASYKGKHGSIRNFFASKDASQSSVDKKSKNDNQGKYKHKHKH